MPLNGHGNRSRVEPIGTVADASPATSRTKRQHLPEGVHQQVEVLFLEVGFQYFGMGVGKIAGNPATKAACCQLP